MKTILVILIAALFAQQNPGGSVTFDKTVHDFGDISIKDGPVSCTFTMTNTGADTVAIFSVFTSCGCTSVDWTKEKIAPGATGKISVTYTNDEGPQAFDKDVKAYITGVRRPVVLHMRGVVHNKTIKK